MRMRRMLACLLVATASLGLVAANTITANLTASPASFTGKCPAEITFKGTITATAPGTVTYKFIRSDNAMAPVQTLVFTQAGTKPVSTTWTLGGPGLMNYSGWEAIEILSPAPFQSNHATFKITCADAKLEVKATLVATPASYDGPCPVAIRLDGEIGVTAPCTVQYKFLCDDSRRFSVQTLVFTQAGTKPVSTTWSLGGPNTRNQTGWGAIEILSPTALQSNHATFRITCTGAKPNK